MRLDFKSIQVSADFDLDVLKRTFFSLFHLDCRVGWVEGKKPRKGCTSTLQSSFEELWRWEPLRLFGASWEWRLAAICAHGCCCLSFCLFFRVSNTRTAGFLFDIKKKGAILQQGHYSSNNTRRVIDSRQVQTKSRLVNIESGKRSQSVRFTSS